MKTLDNETLKAMKTELNRDVVTVDSRICDAEQKMQHAIKKAIVESNSLVVTKELEILHTQLTEYGEGVRELRSRLANLKKQVSVVVSPPVSENKEDIVKKERVATEIQHEIHNKSVTFTDFVKGLFMWQDTPDDRMDS